MLLTGSDCADIHGKGGRKNGFYFIRPDGSTKIIKVWYIVRRILGKPTTERGIRYISGYRHYCILSYVQSVNLLLIQIVDMLSLIAFGGSESYENVFLIKLD